MSRKSEIYKDIKRYYNYHNPEDVNLVQDVFGFIYNNYIEPAEKHLEKAQEVLDFYANKDNWEATSTYFYNSSIQKDDVEKCEKESYLYHGGRKARQYFEDKNETL